MADLDVLPIADVTAAAGVDGAVAREIARQIVWKLFHRYEDERIKAHWWIFRPSVKVANLRPLIIQWVGPDPGE